MATDPIRVAVVNDYEIVVAGIAAMLAPHHERIDVVELDSGLPVITDVDVVLYDTFAAVQADGVDLDDLVRGSDARVVIFSWNLQKQLVRAAMERGAAGYLSKGLDAGQIVAGIEAVHRGETVVPPDSAPSVPDPTSSSSPWTPATGRAASAVSARASPRCSR